MEREERSEEIKGGGSGEGFKDSEHLSRETDEKKKRTALCRNTPLMHGTVKLCLISATSRIQTPEKFFVNNYHS